MIDLRLLCVQLKYISRKKMTSVDLQVGTGAHVTGGRVTGVEWECKLIFLVNLQKSGLCISVHSLNETPWGKDVTRNYYNYRTHSWTNL